MSWIRFVRHAQASFGAKVYDQLSELGFKQSAKLGEYLATHNRLYDSVYIGPLLRHRQTYETVKGAYESAGIAFPEAIVLDGLVEHEGPSVLGKVKEQLIDQNPAVQKWHQESLDKPETKVKNHFRIFNFFMSRWANNELDLELPEHTDWQSFKSGVNNAMKTIMKDKGQGRKVIAFTSGGTKSAIMGLVLGMTDEKKIIGMNDIVINTSFSDFQFSGDRISLHQFNQAPHLSDDLITYV